MEETFRRKLHKHEEDALLNALAVFATIEEARKFIDQSTIDTFEAMLGIEGFISEHMNKAIEEGVNNEKGAA